MLLHLGRWTGDPGSEASLLPPLVWLPRAREPERARGMLRSLARARSSSCRTESNLRRVRGVSGASGSSGRESASSSGGLETSNISCGHSRVRTGGDKSWRGNEESERKR